MVSREKPSGLERLQEWIYALWCLHEWRDPSDWHIRVIYLTLSCLHSDSLNCLPTISLLFFENVARTLFSVLFMSERDRSRETGRGFSCGSSQQERRILYSFNVLSPSSTSPNPSIRREERNHWDFPSFFPLNPLLFLLFCA
jgi:hypothetical protein